MIPSSSPVQPGNMPVVSPLSTAHLLNQHIPQDQLAKMIGAPPQQWRGYKEPDSDKNLPPKWDGNNPSKKLRTWLKDLRQWRVETQHPTWKHGMLLAKTFEAGTWMKDAAERAAPEPINWTDQAWELILTEILTQLKPYLDIEVDILMEEFVYHCARVNKETFSSYVTRKNTKYRDLRNLLRPTKCKCTSCGHEDTKPTELPMEMWGFLLKRGSQMTEEQRKLLHLWGATHFDTPEQITAQMLRLDRPDHLLAQSLANAAQSGVKTYMVETEPDLSVSASESQPVPAIQVGMSATPEGQWIVPGMNDDGTAAFMQTAPSVEENATEDDDESDHDYDMTVWDDD